MPTPAPSALDPRRHAYRPDLADAALSGRVQADRFVVGAPWHVTAGRLSMRRDPTGTAMQTSELLYGETVTLYDRREGWAWVQNRTDGYVGYVPESGLAEGAAPGPDHWVAVLRTPVCAAPQVKAPVLDHLTLSTQVTLGDAVDAFRQLPEGGWVFARHLRSLHDRPGSPLEQARLFGGLPYVWGGRSADGVDCSGLVQLALAACGLSAPRDSDMQAGEVGVPVPLNRDARSAPDEPPAGLRRDDLVFFPGHVGLMLDDRHLFHATAHSLLVCSEPLMAVAARACDAAGRQGILAIRRPQL